ncbi:MAG: efflux RND transporter periplasmic adaptor subunit [Candidatus Hydrogenedentes bacterium]|nr:efflux RND transporter periplasmic adaptor subunit [Candidatus Hydrogenedentota bacterium]
METRTHWRWTYVMGTIALLAIAAFAGAVLLAGCSAKPVAEASQETTKVVPVRITPAETRAFVEELRVQGTLEAKNAATVSARVAGTIEHIFVEEGDSVVAGETPLFQIDSVKLQRAVDVSRQQLQVARCGRAESEANLQRLEAILDKAKADYERYARLYQEHVGSLSRVEQYESEYKQASAAIKHAQSQVSLAGEQVRQAEAALGIAEKDLHDSRVMAPISGRVCAKLLEEGEMAGSGQAVLHIEDPQVLEVSALLPASHYARIVQGETKACLDVYGEKLAGQVISYKSPTIDPKLRTFEIKCLITNPPANVVPGAMADISVYLSQRDGLGVPAAAIQLRSGRPVVFVAEGQSARMVEIEPGLETTGWKECRGDSVQPGAQIVTMGQFLLNDGSPIAIQKEAK